MKIRALSLCFSLARVAQLVERCSEEADVPSSTLGPSTKTKLPLRGSFVCKFDEKRQIQGVGKITKEAY